VLASGEPDFPFFLGWANQTWTGIWHAAPDKVLIEQTYPGADDDSAHFAAVLPALRDPRYFCVDGRPVFYVFRPEQMPDARAFTDLWRSLAERAGLPGLYFVAEMSDLLGAGPLVPDPGALGFDAGVYIRLPADLAPHWRLTMRLRRKLRGGPEVYPYSSVPQDPPPGVSGRVLPCVYPNWDNTPRSGRNGLVLHGSTPELFGRHVRAALARVESFAPSERLLFLKSWNEWAEGNHLEPDQRFGAAYLEVLADELGVRR
jgi:hypothetical protein